MAMKRIKTGVIGCGGIATNYHLPAMARLDNVELVYACDLVKERADSAKERFGFVRCTLDYRDVLADPEV